MIIEEDLYLEHYGKLGMKWGVRRDPKTGVRPLANTLDKSAFGRLANRNAERSMQRSNRRAAMTPEQKKARNKKIAIGVTAAVVAAGVGATAVVLFRHRDTSLSAIKNFNLKPAQRFTQSRSSTPVSSIPRTSAAHKEFLSNYMKQHYRTNAAANENLKKLYSMNETPIHMRQYLPILPGQRSDKSMADRILR